MPGSLLLGIDIGTNSAKGVLCTAEGEVVASAVVEHAMDVPRPGWAEQDAETVWWGGFVALCRQLLSGKYHGEDVGAVGVSAIGPCMLPVDDRGRPLRPGILYGVDTRASAQIDALNASIGSDAIFTLGGQRLTSQAMGPKMRWFRENEPELYRQTRQILTASSYLIFKLTGEYVINRHEAPYSTPLVDLKRFDYDDRFADEVVPLKLLPRMAWTTEIAGVVSANAAGETGLIAGTPVNSGAVDAAAEAVSAGVVEPGDLMIMYGSTMFFIQATAGPQPSDLVWATGYTFPDSYVVAFGMATSGALTRWFRDQFGAEELAAEAVGGPNAYEALSTLAARIAPGSEGLICLPYFSGERTPINDPRARGLFAGLSLTHTKGHLYRAVLEATAYGARQNLDTIKATGAETKRAIAVGGGVKNRLWLQIVADVTQQPQIVNERSIGASYGDAFLAGLASGIVPSIDILRQFWVRPKSIVEPNEGAAAIYDDYAPVFEAIYEQTKTSMHRLADLGDKSRAR